MAEKKDTTGGVITLLERQIIVAPLTSLGLDRMRLLARVYKRIANGEVGVDEFLKIDQLFSMLVSKEDDMWLEEMILDGKLATDEIIAAMLSVLLINPESAKPAPRKRASRARRS